MSDAPSGPHIASVVDLLAIAYRIEAEAVERYTLLAEQMEVHNNTELVAVFRDLARAERIHAEEIRHQAGDIDVVAHARRVGEWTKGEGPEEANLGDAHYLMTPWHALQMALDCEKRALAYFVGVADTAEDRKIKEMAKEFVEEEAEHVNLCHRLLKRYPAPADQSWAHDPDPPLSQE
jgi:rubrerythrin